MKKLLEAWTHRLLNPPVKDRLSTQQIEDRVWATVVIAVTVILFGIVFSLLYSVTFVTQPIKSMAPIDQAYTKMLNDIVLLIVGGIGGVIGKKGVAAVSNAIGNLTPTARLPAAVSPVQVATVASAPQSAMPDWNWMGYKNPELDESWTPPPPPSTPPNHVPPEAAEIAAERAAARAEA